MEARLMRAHRKVDSTHGQVAIMRGPLVYCLESTDLPQDVDVSEITIPRDIEWTPRYEADLLGGVVRLTGRALRFPHNDSALYPEVQRDLPLEAIPIKLIPYYAWKNRGISQISVWLPVR